MKTKLILALAIAALALRVLGPSLGHKAPVPQASLGWIISAPTLTELMQAGASGTLLTKVFDNSATYVTGTNVGKTLPNTITTQTFTSYAALQQAFAASTIAPATKAILYDSEKWQFTPANEQRDPVGFTEKAATLVHQHGLLLIVTPATNLASVLLPDSTNRYDAFLSLNIIGGLAKAADVVEVQAQGAEGTPEYAQFVKAASVQAHAANPSVTFYAGMSTNPTGRLVTAQQLMNDYQATRAYVSGYWLNVPATSPYCPTCGEPHPEVAVAFLQMMEKTIGSSTTAPPKPKQP